mmetsp:Transcript_7844/g.24420  ORF Transcript_7844/g.24420 Transcript_7844/m.24420 type:complete len:231 (-) Transcript_7844:183-875(-)
MASGRGIQRRCEMSCCRLRASWSSREAWRLCARSATWARGRLCARGPSRPRRSPWLRASCWMPCVSTSSATLPWRRRTSACLPAWRPAPLSGPTSGSAAMRNAASPGSWLSCAPLQASPQLLKKPGGAGPLPARHQQSPLLLAPSEQHRAATPRKTASWTAGVARAFGRTPTEVMEAMMRLPLWRRWRMSKVCCNSTAMPASRWPCPWWLSGDGSASSGCGKARSTGSDP